MKIKIEINGMSCNHCVKHVEECLSELDGVKKVEVSLENKSAIIESDTPISEDTIKTALDDYGYEAISFENI